MARARAWQLCPNPSDVDDIVQESFLQAFIALDRLRDPDRFAGWLAGIVHNVCRGLAAPRPGHAAGRLARAAPPGVRRRPALGRGPGPGRRAARGRGGPARRAAARRRPALLRRPAARPDRRAGRRGPGQPAQGPAPATRLPHRAPPRSCSRCPRRTHMTAVRIARAERRIPPGPVPIASPQLCPRARRRRGPPGAADLAAGRRRPPALRAHRAAGRRATSGPGPRRRAPRTSSPAGCCARPAPA